MQPVAYSESPEYIVFYWEGYSDPESDIKQYNVRLLGAPTCSEADEIRTTTVVDWITIDSNYTTYKFVDLELVVRMLVSFGNCPVYIVYLYIPHLKNSVIYWSKVRHKHDYGQGIVLSVCAVFLTLESYHARVNFFHSVQNCNLCHSHFKYFLHPNQCVYLSI